METQKRFQNWTSRVLVDLPEGFVCVGDLCKDPILWLPPGGKGELHEPHPAATAKRELWQETGLIAKTLELIYQEPRPNRDYPEERYTLYLYRATLDWKGLKRLKKSGDEGEIVRVLPRDELKRTRHYHPRYKHLFQQLGYWPA